MIGAGVSGLVAARRLADRGVAVTVLERSERVGGRVMGLQLHRGVVDAGASHVWSFYHHTHRWLRRLGLWPRLAPGGPGQTLRIEPRDLPGILRSGLEVARRWRRLDPSRPERALAVDVASISDYARRHLTPGFTTAAVQPAFEWNAFCSLEELSQVLLLQAGRLFLSARPRVLQGGLQQFPEALGEGLEVRLGREGAVRAVGSSERGAVVELESGRRLSCAGAIVATTPGQAARLCEPEPALSAFLAGIRHSTITRAWWELPAAPGDPEGEVLRVPGEPTALLAAARRGQGLRVALGVYGERALGLVDASGRPRPAQLRALAASCLPAVAERAPLDACCWHWERAVTIFAPGHFRQLAQLRPWRRRGCVVLAGDYLTSPTVEGAVLSGERAAAEALGGPINLAP